ncbi:hypothetical protein FKG94_07275 [Exilibacterium tricleocarpae]|uniref:UspA domain-containing protein n=1 Tax=Exilibacterium tricleocarpae TaxID=2591008 RepID=A0A545TZA3_9GAMM|nr:universal stress protein [Exilibacterium tricleocarpae]TQV82527.1 hypothetical protein FKG94_07275 [Exilibacterium tricleocarpae]
MQQNTLMAVIDPTRDDQIALAKAQQIAATTGAAVHAFCCCYLPAEAMGQYSSKAEAKQATLADIRSKLESLTAPLRQQNIPVTTEAYWNERWYESVIQACARSGADLLIKSTRPHSRLQRALSATSDYVMLRQAPCPVLLVRSEKPWRQRRILAAVTLEQEDREHELLNTAIVTRAQRLARSAGAELHLVSASPEVANLAQILKLLDDDAGGDSQTLIGNRYGVPAEQVHLEQGQARTVIAEAVKRLAPDVLVMGTTARRGLTGVLLGNTAEKVLDAVDVDTLVVS